MDAWGYSHVVFHRLHLAPSPVESAAWARPRSFATMVHQANTRRELFHLKYSLSYVTDTPVHLSHLSQLYTCAACPMFPLFSLEPLLRNVTLWSPVCIVIFGQVHTVVVPCVAAMQYTVACLWEWIAPKDTLALITFSCPSARVHPLLLPSARVLLSLPPRTPTTSTAPAAFCPTSSAPPAGPTSRF